MTNWPKADQYVAVSCIMSPVTQTAEVEVNNASEKGVASPLRLEKDHTGKPEDDNLKRSQLPF